MRYRTTMRFLHTIVIIMGIVFPGNAIAKEIKFQATIFPIQDKPIFVKDFNLNGEHFYDAIQKGKRIKLPFKDIKTIRFLNPGKNYKAEVIFQDDTKNSYVLKPAANITVKSRARIVTLGHSKVASIEFGPSRIPQPQSQSKAEYMQFDRIFLKNGDTLSGQIQTKMFKLNTAYGAFDYEASQISYINFDGREQNIDVMGLRIGDVLSGVLEVESVKLLTRSGKEVNLDSEKIKRIYFKKAEFLRDAAIKKQ